MYDFDVHLKEPFLRETPSAVSRHRWIESQHLCGYECTVLQENQSDLSCVNL